jgi:hypothetical protein
MLHTTFLKMTDYIEVEIENFHHGPEDGTRTRFLARGTTGQEILERIQENSLMSFALKPDFFFACAHLYDRSSGCPGRKEIKPEDPIPAGCHRLYIYFRPATSGKKIED